MIIGLILFHFFISNPTYFLFQEIIVYEERAVTALWEAIDVLTRRVDEIEQKIENNRVVYLRPPKNLKEVSFIYFRSSKFHMDLLLCGLITMEHCPREKSKYHS
jgi:hypothetical protein